MKNYFISDEFIKFNTSKYVEFNTSANFPNEDVSYNWLNIDYPSEHTHISSFEVLIVTNGEIINKVNGEEILMKAGDYCFLSEKTMHSIFIKKKGCSNYLTIICRSSYFINLLKSYANTIVEEFNALDGTKKYELSATYLRKIITTFISFDKPEITIKEKVLQIKIFLNYLINNAVLYDHELYENVPDWYSDFIFKLQNPYFTYKNLDELASYTPYSYSRLSILFKNIAKMTIIEYINNVKIKEAEELLKVSDLTILEITYKLNFESASYFIKLFKKYNKITPHQFRILTKKGALNINSLNKRI